MRGPLPARVDLTASRSDVRRPEATVDQAGDLIWLLVSFDSFDLLHTGRGLSIDGTAGVLVNTAERSLYR